jgi:hypothetical protein
VLLSIGIGMLVYVLCALMLRSPELSEVWNAFKLRKKKG